LNKALKFNKKAFEINGDRITQQVLAQNYIALDDHDNSLLHLKAVHLQYPGVLDEFLEWAEMDILLEGETDYTLTLQLIEEIDPSKKEQIDKIKASMSQ
jgi:hypothetical protein